MTRPAVRHSVEFERVAALPRRALNEADATMWALVWSDLLRAPGSRAELRRWQGQAIAEAVENRGAYLVMTVGAGKTLISYLLGTALASARTLLVLPANLRSKTFADFGSYLGQWRTPKAPARIVSREELALEQNARFLDEFQPTAIIIDESDDLANFDSAAARRLDRYIMARTREECAVVCMSGTPSRNSIMAYWHLLRWCLRDAAPVPANRSEARMWAAAIDQQKSASDSMRVDPGPLGPSRQAAVRWFRTRLQSTPGVMIIGGDSAGDVPLTIRTRLPIECTKIDAAFRRFAVDQETPDGMPCAAPLDRWRLDGFLGCGLWQRYRKPGPPKEWIEARRVRGRAFAALCRDTIKASSGWRDPADTERQVRRKHSTNPIVTAWDEVRDDPYPKEAVWIGDATVRTAVAWLRESADAGIVWCGGVEFAREVARVTGLPYYGREGRDQNGAELHAAPAGKSFVCSWNANKKGFNLQPWRRHAVFNPPSSAKWLEQLFGRAHRSGQDRGVVFDVFCTSGATFDAFQSAIDEAGFARDSVGPVQKILRAKIERRRPVINATNLFRWARK